MLNMDYVTLVNQVLTRINQPTVATLVGVSGLPRSISDKLKLVVDQLSLETDWWVHLEFRQITTIAGTQDYALAADYLKSVMLLNTSTKFRLHQVYPRSFEIRNLVGSAGVVTLYTVEKDNYRLLPIPSSVENLRDIYFRAPAELVNDSDVPDLPREIQFALIEKVTGSVNEDLQQFEKADRNRRGFTEAFKKVLETNTKRMHAILGDELSVLSVVDGHLLRVDGEGFTLDEIF